MSTCSHSRSAFWLALPLACLLLGFVTDVSAQWQWRDEHGHTTFSDRPPPAGVPPQHILKRPGATAPLAAGPTYGPPSELPLAAPAQEPLQTGEQIAQEQLQSEAEYALQQAAIERQNAQVARSNAAVRTANCENARSRLAQVAPGQRVSAIDSQGQAGYLSEAARAAERARLQAGIADNC